MFIYMVHLWYMYCMMHALVISSLWHGLVQRMGRTGRKREGRIVMLVSEGKEEQVLFHLQLFLTFLEKICRFCKSNY